MIAFAGAGLEILQQGVYADPMPEAEANTLREQILVLRDFMNSRILGQDRKWWDVNHDVERVEILDGKKLIVTNPAAAQADSDELTRLRSKRLSTQGFELASARNHWTLLVLFSLLLLIFGLSFFVKPVRDRANRKLESILTTRRTRKALQQACMSNDPTGTRRELLKWGRQRWRLLAAEPRYRPAGSDLPEGSLPNLYPQQDLSMRVVTR